MLEHLKPKIAFALIYAAGYTRAVHDVGNVTVFGRYAVVFAEGILTWFIVSWLVYVFALGLRDVYLNHELPLRKKEPAL